MTEEKYQELERKLADCQARLAALEQLNEQARRHTADMFSNFIGSDGNWIGPK